MNQTLTKICRAVLLAFCIVAYTACPAWAQEQGDGIDEDMKITLASTAESLSQAIVELSQEEIDEYRKSGDKFTESAMEVWENSKKELGEFKSMGKSQVEKTTDGYAVKIPAEFSGQKATMIYLFDQTGAPVSFSIDIQYAMSELLQRAAMNTLMGMGVVFLMLFFLTLVISLFRFIGQSAEVPQNEIKDLPAVPRVKNRIQPQPIPETDAQELIAAIAGAIAAYEGVSADCFVVRSIRKANKRRTR